MKIIGTGSAHPTCAVTNQMLEQFLDTSDEWTQTAEVIAVGPGAIVDGKEVKMEVKLGDKVILSKYSGTEVKIDGEDFVVVRQGDILAIVE